MSTHAQIIISETVSLARPSNYKVLAVPEPQKQVRGYEAIFLPAFYSRPWFYRMYWWK